MNIEDIVVFTHDFIDSEKNTIPAAVSKEPRLVGEAIFDYPLIGVAHAEDSLLVGLRENKEAHVPLIPPPEWLFEAVSVVSFFFPFTKAIREGNRDGRWPSWGWLHGRIEGQATINCFASGICEWLQELGFSTVSPSIDERFLQIKVDDKDSMLYATSNWSERHVAYACGLGTFSLSKGLITNKGVAGRFSSIITSLELEVTPRLYTDLEEYCIHCGICAERCPVAAIDQNGLKNDVSCSSMLDEVLNEIAPYYGCGKCQVGVPCESKRPSKTL